jgi:hypothetical protein
VNSVFYCPSVVSSDTRRFVRMSWSDCNGSNMRRSCFLIFHNMIVIFIYIYILQYDDVERIGV